MAEKPEYSIVVASHSRWRDCVEARETVLATYEQASDASQATLLIVAYFDAVDNEERAWQSYLDALHHQAMTEQVASS